MDSDLWPSFFELHVQSHIYWGVLVSIQATVIAGLLSRTEKISVRNALLIASYIGFTQGFATFGLIRFYSFFRAAHTELVLKTAAETTPFVLSISEYTPLSDIAICSVSLILFIFICGAIWSRT